MLQRWQFWRWPSKLSVSLWPNTSARASIRVRWTSHAVRSFFSDKKRLSIADLAMVTRTNGVPMARSQTFPARIIEHVMLLSVRRR